jgi:DNA-binding SARP family transcriptional activator
MAEPVLPSLAVNLFGPFEARLGETPMPRPRTRKGQWLLALLALRAGREVERGWLAGTLWPDSSEALASGNLRTALNDLRQALGSAAARLCSPSTRTLRLDMSDVRVDVLEFDAAVASAETAALERAVALYGGPLLEGCTEEWAFLERQEREQALLAALESLAERALAA